MIFIIIIVLFFMIWFGFGIMLKVLMVMFICFFFILISFVDGIENIDKDYLNLFKIMDLNKVNIFIYFKFFMVMDKFFFGFKIFVMYVVMVVIVVEWLGGMKGFGVYMFRLKSVYVFDKVFVFIILVVIFSLMFVGIV